MEWSETLCLQLIDEYRRQRVLWDSKDPLHYSKSTKRDAWCHVAKRLNGSVDEVKKKILSLQGSYRREKARVKKGHGTKKGR